MGAHLVRSALLEYPRLSHGAMRLLVGMALTAQDKATNNVEAGLYFAGADAMARLMGQDPDEMSDDPTVVAKAWRTRRREVKRAVAELTRAGVLPTLAQDPRRKAYHGHQATYALRVAGLNAARRGVPVPVDNPASQALPAEEKGDTTVPLMGDTTVREGGHHSPERGTPRSPLGSREELRRTRDEGRTHLGLSSHQGAVDESEPQTKSALDHDKPKPATSDPEREAADAVIDRHGQRGLVTFVALREANPTMADRDLRILVATILAKAAPRPQTKPQPVPREAP